MKKGTIIKTVLLYLVVAGIFAVPIITSHLNKPTGSVKADITAVPLQQLVQIEKTANPTQSASTVLVVGKPTRVVIPRIGIDLPVIDGIYDPKTQSWSLTSNKAQFATVTSPSNNQTGDTLLYGHNTAEVFYQTANLVVGDRLLIYTDNNHVFEYTYTSSKTTTPTDTSIFSYTGKPQVTLLTCNGWFSSYRRLMFFAFTSVLR